MDLFPEYMNNSQSLIKRRKTLDLKSKQNIWTIYKEGIHSKTMKISSTSLIIKEMQIKSILNLK